jgi:fatty acid desaturase
MDAITKQELGELSGKNDLVAAGLLAIRAAFHIGFCVLAGQAFAAGQPLLGVLILVPHLAAYSFLGWAGIGHELFHNSVFSSRALNLFLFRAFSVLTWSNYFYFQVSHPHHHRLTLADNDPEGVQPPALNRLTLLQLWTIDVTSLYRRVRILLLNAFGIVPTVGISAALFPPDSESRARLCAAARVVLGVHLALLIGFVATGAWWLILAVTLAPFCLTFFNRTLAVAQHYGLKGAGRDYAQSARTIVLDPVLGFFYANMNYHVEHHYFPGVPHYNLVRLHRMLADRAQFPHLLRGYGSTLKELRRLGVFDAP